MHKLQPTTNFTVGSSKLNETGNKPDYKDDFNLPKHDAIRQLLNAELLKTQFTTTDFSLERDATTVLQNLGYPNSQITVFQTTDGIKCIQLSIQKGAEMTPVGMFELTPNKNVQPIKDSARLRQFFDYLAVGNGHANIPQYTKSLTQSGLEKVYDNAYTDPSSEVVCRHLAFDYLFNNLSEKISLKLDLTAADKKYLLGIKDKMHLTIVDPRLVKALDACVSASASDEQIKLLNNSEVFQSYATSYYQKIANKADANNYISKDVDSKDIAEYVSTIYPGRVKDFATMVQALLNSPMLHKFPNQQLKALLYSCNHATALEIKYLAGNKPNNGYFNISFYDPNNEHGHVTIAIQENELNTPETSTRINELLTVSKILITDLDQAIEIMLFEDNNPRIIPTNQQIQIGALTVDSHSERILTREELPVYMRLLTNGAAIADKLKYSVAAMINKSLYRLSEVEIATLVALPNLLTSGIGLYLSQNNNSTPKTLTDKFTASLQDILADRSVLNGSNNLLAEKFAICLMSALKNDLFNGNNEVQSEALRFLRDKCNHGLITGNAREYFTNFLNTASQNNLFENTPVQQDFAACLMLAIQKDLFKGNATVLRQSMAFLLNAANNNLFAGNTVAQNNFSLFLILAVHKDLFAGNEKAQNDFSLFLIFAGKNNLFAGNNEAQNNFGKCLELIAKNNRFGANQNAQNNFVHCLTLGVELDILSIVRTMKYIVKNSELNDDGTRNFARCLKSIAKRDFTGNDEAQENFALFLSSIAAGDIFKGHEDAQELFAAGLELIVERDVFNGNDEAQENFAACLESIVERDVFNGNDEAQKIVAQCLQHYKPGVNI